MKIFVQTLTLLLLPILVQADVVISVLYFENTTNDAEYQWLSKGLADMIISDLDGIPGFQIVEREALEKILREQALNLTGLMSDGPSGDVGQLLWADQLIYGAFIVSDDDLRIDAKMSDVKSGSILGGFSVSGDIDDLFELQTKIVGQIREKLGVKKSAGYTPPATESIDAMARFYTGLDHLDNQRYDQAQKEFSLASELDPLYVRAQQGLAESYRFLKAFKKYRQQNEINELYQEVRAIQNRLADPKWLTYADIVMSPEYQAMSPQQQQSFNNEHREYLICNTQAECTWHLMLTFEQIAHKVEEYFSDGKKRDKIRQRVFQIGEESRAKFASDPFLAEILYAQLLALYGLEDYEKLKGFSEQFLITYPDFRMIESVEGFYETALEKLGQ